MGTALFSAMDNQPAGTSMDSTHAGATFQFGHPHPVDVDFVADHYVSNY